MHALKPEYFYRPSQILRRLGYSVGLTKNKLSEKTPWRLPIAFDPGELHGRAMLTHGLSDLRTCEMISRIVRAGDYVVDIGANIGIMTSLMAKRACASGSVSAFEPHPHTRARLGRNVREWSQCDPDCARVEVLAFAVSSRTGTADLVEPASFEKNSGEARLLEGGAEGQQAHQVDTVIFDQWFAKVPSIRLVKIDVEGHEDEVLAGMSRSLADGRIDYLIFEEMRTLPSPACEFVSDFGYRTYLIDRKFSGPQLIPTGDRPDTLVGEATNVLAVRGGEEIDFLRQPGWRCLGGEVAQ